MYTESRVRSEIDHFKSRMEQLSQRMQVVEREAQIYSINSQNLKEEILVVGKKFEEVKTSLTNDIEKVHKELSNDHVELMSKIDIVQVPLTLHENFMGE